MKTKRCLKSKKIRNRALFSGRRRTNIKRHARTVKHKGGAAASLGAWAATTLAPMITSKLTQKASEMLPEMAGNVSSKLAKNSKAAFEAMVESAESWKVFGNGDEKVRSEMKELLSSDKPWSVVQNAFVARLPSYNVASLKMVEAVNYVSGNPGIEVAKNIAQNFAETTEYLKKTSYVSPGVTMAMLEAGVSEGSDERDLSKCVYLGNVTDTTAKNQIASFCIPEINVDASSKCTFMLCYNLADLKKHVQSHKSIGQPVPTFHYAELVHRFPSAVETLGRDMSPEWVYIVENYPNMDSVDTFVLGLVGMCYTFARDNVPVLGTMLRFTEGVANKVYNKTPERLKSMIKKMVKQGKVTLMTFAHNPLIVQGCIALSKFLRLVICVYFSTTEKDGPTFLEVLRYSVQMLEPLARSNPIAAIVMSYGRTLMNMKDIAKSVVTLDLWTLASSVFSLGGNTFDATVATLFGPASMALILPYRIVSENALKFQQGQYVAGNGSAALRQFVSMFGVISPDFGYNLGTQIEKVPGGYLRENIHDFITLYMLSGFPGKWVNTFVTNVLLVGLSSIFGPGVVPAYGMLMKLVKKMFPSEQEPNILMVLYKFASVGASSTNSMLFNIYPFYELRLIALCTQEMLHWFTDVGRCALIRFRIKYDIYAEGLEDPGIKCCMENEVAAVRETIMAEHRRRLKVADYDEHLRKIRERKSQLAELRKNQEERQKKMAEAEADKKDLEEIVNDKNTSPEDRVKAEEMLKETDELINSLGDGPTSGKAEVKKLDAFEETFTKFKDEFNFNEPLVSSGNLAFEKYLEGLYSVSFNPYDERMRGFLKINLGKVYFFGLLSACFAIIEAKREQGDVEEEKEGAKLVRSYHNCYLYELILFFYEKKLKYNQKYAEAVFYQLDEVNKNQSNKEKLKALAKNVEAQKSMLNVLKLIENHLGKILEQLLAVKWRDKKDRKVKFDDGELRANICSDTKYKYVFDPNGFASQFVSDVITADEGFGDIVKNGIKTNIDKGALDKYVAYAIPKDLLYRC